MHDDPNTRRTLDALADLYLTGPEESPGEEVPAPRPAAVEAVLLGHLPGYASPWISQYADEAATHRGGVALLRIGEGHVDLELFGVDDPAIAHRENGEAPHNPTGGGADGLAAALEGLADRVRLWLVVSDDPSGEAARRRLGEIDRWTILTGSDDAAVVGAYRLLKDLLGEGGVEPPHGGVGLMFMGCEEAEARSAADRVDRAASAMLRSPVEKIGLRRRMQPLDRRRIGRFECAPTDPWRVVRAFFTELAEIEPPHDDGSHPDPTAPPELRITASIDCVKPVPVDHPPPEWGAAESSPDHGLAGPHTAPSASGFSQTAREASEEEGEPEPSPAADQQSGSGGGASESQPSDEPAGPADGPSAKIGSDGLAGYLPGVTAIGARSPRHPRVRLAVDVSGRFHLMLRDEAEPLDAAVRELIEARAWTVEHRPLLAMTCGQHADPDADPVLHLFTARPKSVLELAYAGGPDHRTLRLHLLKPVTLAEETVHVHEELN